jgi:hypothetical protein
VEVLISPSEVPVKESFGLPLVQPALQRVSCGNLRRRSAEVGPPERWSS